jgi:hypothetical protein
VRAEVTPHTLNEIATDYDAAVQWVREVGFPVQQGRIAEYRKVIVALSADGWGNLSDPTHRDRVCTALIEIRELISIFRGVSGIDRADAVSGLKHYVKGPFLPTEEDPKTASNRARNIGFELYLNALFAYAGFHPEYGSRADLTFSYSGRRYYVEAKRPLSATAAQTAIRVAKRQLGERLARAGSEQAHGVIALDLTKVINPENKVMPVYGEDHLHSLMHMEDKRQMGLLTSQLLTKPHPRIVCVMLHYKLLTNFLPEGALNTVKWIGWIPFCEDPALAEICAALERIVRRIC